MIEAKGYGLRIREMIADHASQKVRSSQSVRRYTDTEFWREVGEAERGKAYPSTTGADWMSERNEPSIATALAMEVVLERPGAACYIFFGCWPAAGADGKIPATPGAVRSKERKPLPRPAAKAVSAADRRRRANGGR